VVTGIYIEIMSLEFVSAPTIIIVSLSVDVITYIGVSLEFVDYISESLAACMVV
jgi:hypothetical protein